MEPAQKQLTDSPAVGSSSGIDFSTLESLRQNNPNLTDEYLQSHGVDTSSHVCLEEISLACCRESEPCDHAATQKPRNTAEAAKALHWADRAYKIALEKTPEERGQLFLPRILSWIAELERVIGPRTRREFHQVALKKALADPADIGKRYEYMRLLTDRAFIDEMELCGIDGLWDTGSGGREKNRLLEMLYWISTTDRILREEFSFRFLTAAHTTNKDAFYLETFAKLAAEEEAPMVQNHQTLPGDKVRETARNWARLCLACYHLHVSCNTEEGIEILRLILSSSSPADLVSRGAHAMLATALFDKAISNPPLIHNLEALVANVEGDAALKMKLRYLIASAKRLAGQELWAESRAREAVSKMIKNTDIEAGHGQVSREDMIQISRWLFAARRDSDGEMARALARHPHSAGYYDCAGLCSKRWESDFTHAVLDRTTESMKREEEGYYECLYCFNADGDAVRYCKDCHEKLKNDKLWYRTCGPSHRFVHESPILVSEAVEADFVEATGLLANSGKEWWGWLKHWAENCPELQAVKGDRDITDALGEDWRV